MLIIIVLKSNCFNIEILLGYLFIYYFVCVFVYVSLCVWLFLLYIYICNLYGLVRAGPIARILLAQNFFGCVLQKLFMLSVLFLRN